MMLAQSLRALALKGNDSEAELVQARAAVHVSLVRLACEAAQPADFEAIEQNLRALDGYAAEGDMVRRAEAAITFFKQLTTAAPALTPLRWQVLSCLHARDADGAAAAMSEYLGLVACSRAAAKQPSPADA